MKKFFLFFLLVSAGWAQIDKNGDFQIWTREIIKKHFNPTWAFLIMQENRIGDDASKLFHIFLHAQGIYKPTQWLGIAPGYRQSWRRFPLNSNHWLPEYSPLIDVTFVMRPGDWQFVDRNRVQYRVIDSDPSHWLYRNRFRIIPPWSFTRFCLNPFIDNEILFHQRFGFDEDRLCGGFLLWIYENLSGQLYYMCRFLKKEPHWIHTNVLNVTLLLAY